MRSSSVSSFQTEEYKDDEVLEYLKYSPSKSEECINQDIYYAVKDALDDE